MENLFNGTRDWTEYDAVKITKQISRHQSSARSCCRQLMSDVPYSALLGGLDSSITSAVAKNCAQKRIESDDTTDAWYPQDILFSVGLGWFASLAAAQIVANHMEPFITKLNSPFKKVRC
jgi:asparagine synthase (glutamine-hydrolysing)